MKQNWLDKNRDIILDCYEYFYSRLTSHLDYQFKPSKLEIKILDNFLLKNNNPSYGENFWYQYFCFQFEYWRNKNTRLGKNDIQFNWVIGDKAWTNFSQKPPNFMYFCEINFVKIYKIDKEEIFIKKQKTNYLILNNREEALKELNFGKETCLLFCLLYTTLFNSKSSFCSKCSERFDCKKILKSKYPNIFKERKLK